MKQIILINLGGPRTPDEVYPFLYDLFTDPYVFDLPLPEFFRIRLAKFIAKRRTPRVRNAYESMGYGGGSPLYEETEKQGRALVKKLIELTSENWQFKIAMACGYPNIREFEPKYLIPSKENILIPLFPQFSRSTTMSINKLVESIIGFCPSSIYRTRCNTGCQEKCKESKSRVGGWIGPFYDEPEYVEATSQLIFDYFQGNLENKNFLKQNFRKVEDWENIPILFSAHGIPMRLVKKGDIYPLQVDASRKLIYLSLLKKYGYKGETYLSYQSKVGPAKWTKPSTIEKIQELGKKGIKRLAIYPLSFVSDHLETLEEIGEQLRDVALESGITEYYRIPAPGTYQPFIDFLANRVKLASL